MRVRRVVGEEVRRCLTCGEDTTAEIYQSWEREHRRPFGWRKRDVRTSARCLSCGYRTILSVDA